MGVRRRTVCHGAQYRRERLYVSRVFEVYQPTLAHAFTRKVTAESSLKTEILDPLIDNCSELLAACALYPGNCAAWLTPLGGWLHILAEEGVPATCAPRQF